MIPPSPKTELENSSKKLNPFVYVRDKLPDYNQNHLDSDINPKVSNNEKNSEKISSNKCNCKVVLSCFLILACLSTIGCITLVFKFKNDQS